MGAGTYPLASFGSLTNNSSGFSGWAVTGTGLGGHGYAFAISGGSLDLTVLPATAVAWKLATGGSWNTTTNWQPATIPNTWYYTATFGNTIGSTTATVTLDSSPTVCGLTFSNTGTSSYILARSDSTSTLTLDNGVAPVTLSNTTASNTIAVPVVLNSNLAISGTTGKTLTISGPVSGAAALSFSGGGSLVLSGSNTYTGGTTISGGVVQLGDGASKNGSVAGNITDNARLTFANPNAQTFAGAISGSGSVTKTAAGALVLTGTNTYTGGTTVTSGTLDFATPDAMPSTGIVTVPAGCEVALGALSGASSPATDATETAVDAGETGGTVATSSPASAGGAAATGGGVSLGGMDSMAEAGPAAAVPEPSSIILLGVGAAGLLGYIRRRKRTSRLA